MRTVPTMCAELKRNCCLLYTSRYLTEQEQAQYDKIQAEKELAEEDAIQARQPEDVYKRQVQESEGGTKHDFKLDFATEKEAEQFASDMDWSWR